VAVYDDQQYVWPEDYDKLTHALATEIHQVQESTEPVPVKKSAKAHTEEEPVTVSIGLAPNIKAGEQQLEGRNDLKAKLSDMIKEGVEFAYAANDIGWQWALDRANWSTILGEDLTRKIRVKAAFTQGAVGLELGTASSRRRTSRAKAAPKAEPEPEVEAETDGE